MQPNLIGENIELNFVTCEQCVNDFFLGGWGGVPVGIDDFNSEMY